MATRAAAAAAAPPGGGGRGVLSRILRVLPSVAGGMVVAELAARYLTGALAAGHTAGSWWSVPLAAVLGIPVTPAAPVLLPVSAVLVEKGARTATPIWQDESGDVMERVLVIEDDVQLANLVALYLQDAGFEVAIAATGPEGVQKVAEWSPHLVILDLMLPGMEGWEVCRHIRRSSRVPVLMVTALGEEEDRLRGFAEGADDYVVKPFLPRELVARVRAHIRRAAEPPVSPGRERIEYPGFALDRERFTLHVDGQAVDLTPKEFELLWLLAANPGRAFPRDRLLERIWGYDAGDARTLEVHVSRLREKLGRLKGWIKTVWGVGYKFEAETR